MKLEKAHTLKQIADILNVKFIGDENFQINGFNEIHRVEKGDIVFVDHPKYYEKALNSAASVVLINKIVECPQGKALLISEDPFSDFNKLKKHFLPQKIQNEFISSSAKIGKNTIIFPGVFIGEDVEIGEDCIIYPNASILGRTKIGNRVIIHSGAVLGADAFYYKKRETGFDKLLSSGNVVIEDDVEIGACSCIDRGVSADTRIKKGTKIDNQVHIGHDTIIGEECLIASQTGVAGCNVLENQVVLWGQVGITSGVTIGEKAVLLAQSGVTKSLKPNNIYFGSPAEEVKKHHKQLAFLKILPDILKKKGII